MKIRKEGFLLFRDMKFLVRKNPGYCIFQSLVTNYENQIEFRILTSVVRDILSRKESRKTKNLRDIP